MSQINQPIKELKEIAANIFSNILNLYFKNIKLVKEKWCHLFYLCFTVSIIIKSPSAAVLAASLDRLGPNGPVQVSTLIKSSLAAAKTSTEPCGPNRFKEVASAAANDDLIRVETCTDPCDTNRSKEAAITAADDDLIRVEACTEPCCPNRSKEAAGTAAGDDLIRVESWTDSCSPNRSKETASTAADDDSIIIRQLQRCLVYSNIFVIIFYII